MRGSCVSFPFSWAVQPEAHFHGCWLSLPHLVTNDSCLQTNWLPVLTELYNSWTPTFLWASQIALIQPIHGQGYNILIDRMHLLFTKVHFLFWQLNRVLGQYTTIWQAWIQFFSSRLVSQSRWNNSVYPTITYSWKENNWFHTFPKYISIKWNANGLGKDLNSGHRVYILRQ